VCVAETPEGSRNSCGIAVILEQATDPLPTSDCVAVVATQFRTGAQFPDRTSAILIDFFRRRPTYALNSRNVTSRPSAARHSEMVFRLWPLSIASLISGQRLRIWAAFVGGFFSRNAASRETVLKMVLRKLTIGQQ
jgi:hypothetical protein